MYSIFRSSKRLKFFFSYDAIKWFFCCRAFSIIGLVIITFGDGCLVTLVPTFGAEQYKSTEVKNIDWFFSLFYFMYNCGSIISRFVSPILREDVKCFGNDDCFPLAFGLPVVLMTIVTILIVIANRYSEIKQVNGTSVLNVFACIKVKPTAFRQNICTLTVVIRLACDN